MKQFYLGIVIFSVFFRRFITDDKTFSKHSYTGKLGEKTKNEQKARESKKKHERVKNVQYTRSRTNV